MDEACISNFRTDKLYVSYYREDIPNIFYFRVDKLGCHFIVNPINAINYEVVVEPVNEMYYRVGGRVYQYNVLLDGCQVYQ